MTKLCLSNFKVRRDDHDLYLPYCRNHSLNRENTDVTRVVFAIHGSNPIARDYYKSVLGVATLIPSADVPSKTLIVAPQFIRYDRKDNITPDVPNYCLLWDGDRFEGGLSHEKNSDDAIQPFRMSSFSVLDRMLREIVRSGNFPNLRRIVIIGQSGGGALVHMYAASNMFHRTTAEPAGIPVRYIAMNGSHGYYFTDERIKPGGGGPSKQYNFDFEVPTDATIDAAINLCNRLGAAPCLTRVECRNEYNKYPYGLDDLINRSEYHYDNHLTAADLRHQYSTRNVVHMVGSEDRRSGIGHHDEYNTLGLLAGRDRQQHAVLYFAHLQQVFGERLINRNHRLVIVPGVGHGGRPMIFSAQARPYIFGQFEEVKMATLADYTVVWDSVFTLSLNTSREKVFEFDLPGNIVSTGNYSRPILGFFADPANLEDAWPLSYAVNINGTDVWKYTYTGGVGRQHTEVLAHDNLRPGMNSIRFNITGGRGSIEFQNVVVWYQQNISLS